MKFRLILTLVITILVSSIKKDGISFIVKALNEETTLEKSIKSIEKVNNYYIK